MNLDLKDFIVSEESVFDYELPQPVGITFSYEFNFNNAKEFTQGNSQKITFSPKIGDEG